MNYGILDQNNRKGQWRRFNYLEGFGERISITREMVGVEDW